MTDYRLKPVVLTIFLLGFTAQALWANGDDCLEEYDVDWFIEINATDGDAGAQLLLDGEQWVSLHIGDPDGRQMLKVQAKRSIADQGLTEFFFESAEPSFDERPLAEFLELFPEGEYVFEGELRDGGAICATADFSHNLPGAPDVDAELNPDGNLVISWEEADGSLDHPEAPVRDIEVDSYQVIAEVIDGDVDFAMVLPAEATEVTLPPEFLADTEAGDVVKYEVICKEDSGNQTITEATFEL
jgi:hypothetical protein